MDGGLSPRFITDMNKEKLRHWSWHKQCLGQKSELAVDAMQQVIGVYSTHPCGPLSLLARVKNLSPADFLALDQEKKAYRMPAMRGSVHMLPAQSATKIFRAVIEPASSGVWEKRYLEEGRKIPVEFYDDWMNEIFTHASEPKHIKELKTLVNIPPDKLKFVLNRMGLEGYVLRYGAKSPRSNIISYVNTRSWMGNEIPETPASEVLPWLAKEYLRAFGPARAKDFKWWTGVKAPAAKAAIEAIETIELDEGYLILPEELDAFESFESKAEGIDILPQWDCYTMGYAPDGRDRFVKSDYLKRLYGKLGATGGNALGALMIDGEVKGVWTSRMKSTTMEITLDQLEPISKPVFKKATTSFEAVAAFLDAKKVKIEFK